VCSTLHLSILTTKSVDQVHELEIPKGQAEKLLAENGGDIQRALRAYVSPPS